MQSIFAEIVFIKKIQNFKNEHIKKEGQQPKMVTWGLGH